MKDFQLLHVGHCFHPEAIVMKGHSWKKMQFPAIVGLLKHPRFGNILFDTGYAERFIDETQHFPNKLYRLLTPMHLDKEQTLIHQLNELSLSQDDIDYIFISHFHADHIAGLIDFPKAMFICSESALKGFLSIGNLRGLMKGYLKNLLPTDFATRVKFIEECPEVPVKSLSPFERGYDIFGDGSYFAISLQGHAFGHFGLLSYHDDTPHFLVGDACWTREAYTEGARPMKVAGLVMDNFSLYLETMEKVGELYGKNKDIRLFPSHCLKTFEEFSACSKR